MPGGFPLVGDICNGQSVGVVVGSGNVGTAITAGAANTKGTWTAFTPLSPIDCCLLEVILYGVPAASNTLVVDIGIGPSTPLPLISNLIVACGGGNGTLSSFLVPCSIPKGSVISARAQSYVGGDTAYVALKMYDGAFTQMEGVAGCDTLGFTGASTTGTPVTFGNASKGSWATIIGNTTRDYIGFCVGFDQQNGSGGYQAYSADIGVGPSSPSIIIPDVGFANDGAIIDAMSNFYPVSVPAGSLLSARGQGSSYATAAMGVTFYGFYK